MLLPVAEKLQRTRALVALLVVLLVFGQTLAAWATLALFALPLELTLLGYLIGPRSGYGIYVAGILLFNPVTLHLVEQLGEVSLFDGTVPGLIYSFAFAAHLCVDRLLGFAGPHPGRFATIAPPAQISPPAAPGAAKI